MAQCPQQASGSELHGLARGGRGLSGALGRRGLRKSKDRRDHEVTDEPGCSGESDFWVIWDPSNPPEEFRVMANTVGGTPHRTLNQRALHVVLDACLLVCLSRVHATKSILRTKGLQVPKRHTGAGK